MSGSPVSCPLADEIQKRGDSGDIPGLVALLHHKDASVRECAADALGKTGPVALPLLIGCLNSPDAQVRLAAVSATGLIRDPVSVPALSDLARTDPSTDVRWAALLALGGTDSPAAEPVCRGALKDANRYVRYAAAMALLQRGWEPADDSQRAYSCIALQDWDGLRTLGRRAAGPMRDMLRDDDPLVRKKLIALLGNTGTPEAVDGCGYLLHDRRDSVRYVTVLSALKSGMAAGRMPLLVVERERTGPNPAVAALLNFLFLGIGYNYIGKWWGFLLFMGYMSIIVLAQLQLGPFVPYLIAYPVTAVFAIQTYREAQSMIDA